ncbi:MAG: winged helix DNA-binding domain-containing protein [Chloroflexi bacterium]|nr:MAG: winged helix DNA-binding domain-containing protein [Chloroflexota bacterium]
MTKRLELTRARILAHRRKVGALDERLPMSAASLRRVAWAGLQDSMPRAALLSIHARVKGTSSSAWEHAALVQVWGPRFSAYVVPARDVAVFTRGRMPDDEMDRLRFEELAERLHGYLKGRKVRFGEVARPLRLPHHNYIRYATVTGRLRIRWEGARQPVVWTESEPRIDYRAARLELARRHLHVFGPTTPVSFAQWAGIAPRSGSAAFDALARSLTPVRTPIGDAWILSSDEPTFRAAPSPSAPARLLPSGDAYFLLRGVDRELLVPEARRRSALWPSRVWPGAVLVHGEVVGTWRRAGQLVDVESWRRLSRGERDAVETEARALPLPDVSGQIRVRWDD